MRIEDLQVMLLGDPFAVPEPGGDDVTREPFRQFRLAGTSQVVPQTGPGNQAGPFDNLGKLGSKVYRSPVAN